MKIDGTSMRRPANSWSSDSNAPPLLDRYQLRPPWNPVRWYSPAYTASSAAGSHRHAAISRGDGISFATAAGMSSPRSMMYDVGIFASSSADHAASRWGRFAFQSALL